jgi:hypothetical protein
MNTTQAITAESLADEYASVIASSVELEAADYDSTEDGLASLLRDAAERLGSMDQTGEWLEDAASDLDAIARLGSDNESTQLLFARVDGALYEVKSELI